MLLKVIVPTLLVFHFVINDSGLVESDADLHLMTSSKIGPVSLGMTEEEINELSEIYELSRKLFYSEEHGEELLQFQIELKSDASILIEFFAESTVQTLSTKSSWFVTFEGASVGVSAEELIQKYPSGKFINFWNEGIHRSFIIDDGDHGVFLFGRGRCEAESREESLEKSDCNKVLPSEKTISYWTNAAYTKPGAWN